MAARRGRASLNVKVPLAMKAWRKARLLSSYWPADMCEIWGVKLQLSCNFYCGRLGIKVIVSNECGVDF